MKKFLMAAVFGAVAIGAVACGGKSAKDVCVDECNQLTKCAATISGGSSGSTGTTTGTDCATQCNSAASGNSGSSSTCNNLGAVDDCVNAVDTTKSTCLSDIGNCSSKC